mmetsp:Transcript_25742/g.68398  ORF Transcript_25742/g.68398 Transcript_25742/m.68398 type:complete len:136 (+) Transcript_25742:3-410(+)
MSEPVLWIQWKHVGQMIADTHCELMTVQSGKVQELLRRLEEPQRYAREYASFFQRNPHLLTDVWQDHELIQDMAVRAFTPLDEEDGLSPKEAGDRGDEPLFEQSPCGSGGCDFTPVMPSLPGTAPEIGEGGLFLE